MQASAANGAKKVLKMPAEPDLSATVDLASDRLSIRNLIYTAWSIFNSEGSSLSSPYSKWKVDKLANGRGYVLEFHFAKAFRISLQDMLVLQDACPLRTDSIFVEAAADDDNEATQHKLCICLLNAEQPVQLTETEVVRIRKRSRGLLSTAKEWLAARKR